MPFCRFTVPAGGPSAECKAGIAAAVIRVHTSVTGAPASYVNVSFTEVPPGSLFVASEEVRRGRMVGTVHAGRTPKTKQKLLTGSAAVWSGITGEPREGFALFLQEAPGGEMLEDDKTLPEASGD